MEEASRPVPWDRKAAESLAVIPGASPVPWEHMPREPHLLDYLIILRKHQWLIATFLLTVVTVVTIASFKMKPVYIGRGARGSGQRIPEYSAVSRCELRRIHRYGKLCRDTGQNPTE